MTLAEPAPPVDAEVGIAQRLLRGASWSFLAQILPVITSIGLTPFLVHRLGMERYGLYVLAFTAVAFLRTFDGGLAGTAIRFFAVYAGADKRQETTRLLVSLLSVVALVGGLIAIVAELLAPQLVDVFVVAPALRDQGTFLLRVMILVVIVSIATGLISSVLVARQRFAWLSMASVVGTVVSTTATVILIERGFGLKAIALVLAGQTALTAMLVLPAALPWLQRSIRPASRAELRNFFHYSLRTQLVSVGSLVTLESDSLIVGLARGPRAVTRYSVGAAYALQLRQVVLNGLAPISAQLGRSFGARGHDARPEFEALQRVWVVGVTAWCAAGIGSAYVAMTVWLGPGYAITGLVATVLGVSNMINLWTGVTTSWLQITGYPGIESRYSVLGVVINLVLTAALVAPLGLYGVMVGTAVGQVASSLYLLRLISRGVTEPLRSFVADVPWTSGLLTLVVTLTVEFTLRPSLPGGPVGLLICGLLTLPGLAVFLTRERSLVSALRTALSAPS